MKIDNIGINNFSFSPIPVKLRVRHSTVNRIDIKKETRECIFISGIINSSVFIIKIFSNIAIKFNMFTAISPII